MSPRTLIVLTLLLGAASVDAAETASTKPARAVSPAIPKVAPKAAPKRTAGRVPGGAPKSAKAGAAPRRLEDIHIEGEIPVPQVLFITARDQRRFMDFHHRRYLRTSRELGEATAFPTRIVVTGTGGNDDRKETTR